MAVFMRLIVIVAIGYVAYGYFVGFPDPATAKVQAETKHAVEGDLKELQAHMEALGPELQSKPAAIYNFEASSGAIYRYEVIKSNYGYCPHRKKNIYRNISLKVLN